MIITKSHKPSINIVEFLRHLKGKLQIKIHIFIVQYCFFKLFASIPIGLITQLKELNLNMTPNQWEFFPDYKPLSPHQKRCTHKAILIIQRQCQLQIQSSDSTSHVASSTTPSYNHNSSWATPVPQPHPSLTREDPSRSYRARSKEGTCPFAVGSTQRWSGNSTTGRNHRQQRSSWRTQRRTSAISISRRPKYPPLRRRRRLSSGGRSISLGA